MAAAASSVVSAADAKSPRDATDSSPKPSHYTTRSYDGKRMPLFLARDKDGAICVAPYGCSCPNSNVKCDWNGTAFCEKHAEEQMVRCSEAGCVSRYSKRSAVAFTNSPAWKPCINWKCQNKKFRCMKHSGKVCGDCRPSVYGETESATGKRKAEAANAKELSPKTEDEEEGRKRKRVVLECVQCECESDSGELSQGQFRCSLCL